MPSSRTPTIRSASSLHSCGPGALREQPSRATESTKMRLEILLLTVRTGFHSLFFQLRECASENERDTEHSRQRLRHLGQPADAHNDAVGGDHLLVLKEVTGFAHGGS